jgi:hypothetical protein
MFFTLRREGTFICELSGSIHCGLLPINEFRYQAEICVTDNGLDSQGFIMDNADIQKYFDSIGATDLSCELLACNTARHFAGVVLNNSHDCVNSVKVVIWGIPTSNAEYVWQRGDSLTPMIARQNEVDYEPDYDDYGDSYYEDDRYDYLFDD